MTAIEINEILKDAYCPPVPQRKDLFIVDDCPACNATIGAIRHIKENTKSVNVKCGNCHSTLKVSTVSNEINVIVNRSRCIIK